ncbi:uncharacterized protein LOC144174784 isoform X2 [Haemaphysalis longicornis]
MPSTTRRRGGRCREAEPPSAIAGKHGERLGDASVAPASCRTGRRAPYRTAQCRRNRGSDEVSTVRDRISYKHDRYHPSPTLRMNARARVSGGHPAGHHLPRLWRGGQRRQGGGQGPALFAASHLPTHLPGPQRRPREHMEVPLHRLQTRRGGASAVHTTVRPGGLPALLPGADHRKAARQQEGRRTMPRAPRAYLQRRRCRGATVATRPSPRVVPGPKNLCSIRAFRRTSHSTTAAQNLSGSAPPARFTSIVTKLTSEVRSLGTVSWPLLLCLLGGWIVTYLNVIRGKISFRKTAIVPAIVLILFMCAIFGTITSDPGFLNGLHYFFSFEWKTLRKPDVWNDAAAQVALSLCTGTSLLQLLGRRGSKYRGLVHDAVIVVLVNIVVSFFSGVVVFSCLGFVSKAINRTCVKFLQEGFGTLFSVVPAALASLPGSVVCSILFFALLALLCLGRMEQMMLTLLTCLLDKFSSAQIRKRYCLFVLAVCGVLFAAGVVFTTPAGIHILAVMDAYVFSWTAFLLGFLECVVITWIYGFKQFAEDADTILQQTLGRGWMIIWSFVTPGIILVTLVFTIFGSPDISSGLFKNSFWGPILGWTLFAVVICHIPGYVIYKIVYTGCYTDGNRWDEFKRLVKPVPLCTNVMRADKNAKAGKESAPAPRILVIRKDESNQHGQLYIPYGFVVCPEKSPKTVKGAASHRNNLVFSFPDVDQSYSLTDSNVARLMPPRRCDEIFFYTPQMSQMRKKLHMGSTEQLPQSPSSSSTHELSEGSNSDNSDAPKKEDLSVRRVSLVFTTGESSDDRIVLSPCSLSKCPENPDEAEAEASSESVSVGGGARTRCKRRSSLGALRAAAFAAEKDTEAIKTSHV